MTVENSLAHNPEIGILEKDWILGLALEAKFEELTESEQFGVNVPMVFVASEFKAGWQAQLFNDLLPDMRLGVSEWDEDGYVGDIFPEKSAAKKVVRIANKEVGKNIRFGTDVMYLKDGKMVGKPNDIQSNEEMCQYLMGELGLDVEEVGVEVGMAFCNTPDEDSREKILGVSSSEKHAFRVSPLSEEEIRAYVEKYGYETLKQANMGCFWVDEMMESHIMEIDGVSREDDNFELVRDNLYLSLLGAPRTGRDLLFSYAKLLNTFNYEKVDQEGSYYPDMEGNWLGAVLDKKGEWVFLSELDQSEVIDASKVIVGNFRRAPSYSKLEDEVREKFIEANSEGELLKTCRHPNSFASIVVINEAAEVVGVYITREMSDSDSNAVSIRRAHVALDYQRGHGIGTIMQQRLEHLMKERGFNKITVGASGSSAGYFEKMGFDEVVQYEAVEGVFNDDGAKPDMVMMVKNI